MGLELDHIFILVEPEGPEAGRLKALGLVENYRRDHPGQGTSNICYCFDNAFLELLWLTDEAEARAPAIARTQLAERARWRENGASPFGIALRRVDSDTALPFPTWPYRPPHLSVDRSISVAEFSDDPAQPFVFESPRGRRPDQPGSPRQTAAGLTEIGSVEIVLPEAVRPASELLALADDGIFKVLNGSAQQAILTLRRDDGPPLRLSLPDCRLI